MSRRVATSIGPTGPSWAVLADVLLRRAALVVRVAFDHRPDPLAGLKVDDEDLEKLLTELPGLAVADQSVIAAIERETRPAVDAARVQLQADVSSISGPTRFADLSVLPVCPTWKPRSSPCPARSRSTLAARGWSVTLTTTWGNGG